MARHLVGEKTIPQSIWPFVSKSESRPDAHDPSHAYVVEISSAKSVTLDGSPVQLNYLVGAHPAVFEDAEVARQYWKFIDAGDLAAIQSFLLTLPLTNAERSILLRIRRSWVTLAELEQDMAALIVLFPKVVFVTHVNAVRSNGWTLDDRSKLIGMVEEAAQRLGAVVVNPTHLMAMVGQKSALSDPENGLAHYTPAFEDLMAYALEHALNLEVPRRPASWDQPTFAREALFEAAADRITDPTLAMRRLIYLAEDHLESAAQPIWHLHTQCTKCSDRLLSQIAPHLGPMDRTMIWIRHDIGAADDLAHVSAERIADIIDAVPAEHRHVKIPQILNLWGHAPTPVVDTAIEAWLATMTDQPKQLAKACSNLLSVRSDYRCALRHVADLRHSLVLMCEKAETLKDLEQIATINAALPIRVQSVDLALSRTHFKAGRYQDAIQMGLFAQRGAPENLTNLILLMRAAVRSGDRRSVDFAKQVLKCAPSDSAFISEASRLLTELRAAA